jgi:beta-lactamase domain protein
MKEIIDGVFYCGIHDKTRKIFDQLVPLPQGTTYNSYLVRGSEKSALIDTMYQKFGGEYVDMIVASGVKLDYIVSNHAEPDHSGMIPKLLELFPDAAVYCSSKCSENLQNMLHIDAARLHVVADGEELSLGGRTLKFYLTPWVHWPDTMFTHLVEDNLLFTCDFFGAHYTKNEVFADCSSDLANSAKRYYAEIMMPFANFCAKYLAKTKELAPKMILPSHGPIYRGDDVAFIENLYSEWTSGNSSKKVILAYVSMYDNTTLMADYLENALVAKGLEVVKIDIMDIDEGEIAIELVDAAGLIFGTSMVLTGPHPKSVYLAYLANILRPKLKFTSIIGSFGWGGNLVLPINSMFTLTKPRQLSSVVVKGRPRREDFEKLDALAAEIKEAVSL